MGVQRFTLNTSASPVPGAVSRVTLVNQAVTGPTGTSGTGGDMMRADNLSGLANTATARANLGLGSAATAAMSAFDASGTAAGLLSIHSADTSSVHGITDTSALLDTADIGTTVQAFDADIATVAASQAEMEAGTETAVRSMSPLRVAQAISALGGAGGGGSLPAQAPLAFNDSTTPYVGVPGVALGARGGALSVPANEYRASMLVVFAPITITEARVSVESAGTAATNCRLSIYEQDTADGNLGALVADLGTVSIASTGQKRLTGLSVSLLAGVYLVRAHNQSTASLTWFAGYCPWWSASPLGNNNNPLAMFAAGVAYGAAEDPGTKAGAEFGDVSGTSMYVLVQFGWTVD